MVHIKELTNKEELSEAYPVMKQLRTDLTAETYFELLTQMKKEGYQLFALYDEEKIASLAGLSWRTNFYNKKHIYIYDLITDAAGRSRGYGESLLSYIHNWGKENGAEFVALESGIQRKEAHRFYEEKLNYDKWCYSFRKTL